MIAGMWIKKEKERVYSTLDYGSYDTIFKEQQAVAYKDYIILNTLLLHKNARIDVPRLCNLASAASPRLAFSVATRVLSDSGTTSQTKPFFGLSLFRSSAWQHTQTKIEAI